MRAESSKLIGVLSDTSGVLVTGGCFGEEKEGEERRLGRESRRARREFGARRLRVRSATEGSSFCITRGGGGGGGGGGGISIGTWQHGKGIYSSALCITSYIKDVCS